MKKGVGGRGRCRGLGGGSGTSWTRRGWRRRLGVLGGVVGLIETEEEEEEEKKKKKKRKKRKIAPG